MDKTINSLVPVHKKLSEEDISQVLTKYNISSKNQLPKIKVNDPALAELDATLGNVIEISRNSFAGESKYYRVVVE